MISARNRFLKNTVMLTLLTFAQIGLSYVIQPYLARILSVDVYGVYSYCKTVMNYFSLFLAFGFSMSVTRDIATNENKILSINDILNSANTAKLILIIISVPVLGFLIKQMSILHDYETYVIISFFAVIANTFLFDYYFRGIERMELLTLRFVLTKSITTLLTILLVKSDQDFLYIAIWELLGNVIAVFFTIMKLHDMGISIGLSKIKNGMTTLRQSMDYFFSDFSITIFNSLNTLVVGAYFSKRDIAYWSLAMLIIMGGQMLCSPIANSIYPIMIKTKNFNWVKKYIKPMILVTAIGTGILFFFSENIFCIIGGEKYSPGAYVLRYLSPVLFMGWFSVIFGWPTLGAIGKSREIAVSTGAAATIHVFGLVILISTNVLSLRNLAMCRCITELTLFMIRVIFCIAYRREFTKERINVCAK